MAIYVPTSTPKALLELIRKAIQNKNIDTWMYDDDGDFTHVPDQWKGRAWFRPVIQQGMLSFGLVGQEKVKMSKSIYGVYHGRFIEMLLTHFDDKFNDITATASAGDVDIFK